MSIKVSPRLGWRLALGAVLGSVWIAGSALAVALNYPVVQAESNTFFQAGALVGADVNPDFLNAFPTQTSMLGISNTAPGPLSKVTADVGLPGGFNNGANGITFTDIQIRQITPGTITGIGGLPVALDVLGNQVALVAFAANVSFFSIVLDAPFSSSLIPTGNPDEWLWAGLANVTLSGFFEPIITVPTQPDLPSVRSRSAKRSPSRSRERSRAFRPAARSRSGFRSVQWRTRRSRFR